MRRILRTDELAARQHGVIARGQLLGAGWSESRIDREIRARRLHRVHDGVYAVGHRALGDQGRWLAAALACGGVVSHQSAAALHGLPVSDNGLAHVTSQHCVRRARIASHRATLAPRDRTVRHRIPVTSIARTLADVSHTLDDAAFHRAVREAQFKGLFDEAQVTDALSRRRSRRLARYLGDDTLTQSELEDAFVRLCRRHRIPALHTQYGTKPRVDFIWHEQRLIVEVDGWKADRARRRSGQRRARSASMRWSGSSPLVRNRSGSPRTNWRAALGAWPL
jgi:very-short-patch-repair endonuclease